MSDPMAEIRASFFVECEELLEALHDGLQAIDDGVSDGETVNMVFRSVHSIKGGAGAFGLDTLVAFAHTFETALDQVRSGRLVPEDEVLKLFFHSCDILGDLVRECRDGRAHAQDAYAPALTELENLVVVGEAPAEVDIEFQPTPLGLDLDFADRAVAHGAEHPEGAAPGDRAVAALGGFAASPHGEARRAIDLEKPGQGEATYRIRFKPDSALYAHGIEPLFLFRALREIGSVAVRCRDDDLPGLDTLDCEHSHIGWELTLHSGAAETAVRDVFDFVEGRCMLEIEASESGAPGTDLPDLAPTRTRSHMPDTSGASILPRSAETGSSVSVASGDRTADPATPESVRDAPHPEDRSTPMPAPAPKPRTTIRVDLERIDRLVNLVGEIVINQAMLTQSVEAAGLAPNSPVRAGLDEFLQLTRDIQESVMMIRAQPVKPLFQRMSRIVREASAGVGKEIRLTVEGEHTEVDRTVIERLADPLTHMVRNAVDHGIESGDEREAAGKPRQGNVTLSARHCSGRILIEVGDDGAGIDRTTMLHRATELGLVPASAQLTDPEIDNLLFSPGLTTAPAVSNLSGRGVGMDVVRSAILALGGRISITSEPGRGSTFSISLPLTLAVLDGMVVRAAGVTLIVPLNTILETLALTENRIRALGPDSHVVNIREHFVPLLDLGAELGYRDPLGSYIGNVVLVIGQEDGAAAAIAVDAIEDQRQVVIKGLHESYGRVPGIAAATILGDGQVGLILDPIELITAANGHTRPRGSAPARSMETEQSTRVRV